VDALSRPRLLQGAVASAAIRAALLRAWPAPVGGRVVVAREPNRAKAVAACFEAGDVAKRLGDALAEG